MRKPKKTSVETLTVHDGVDGIEFRPVTPPINQTSTFGFESADRGARLFAGEQRGYICSSMDGRERRRRDESASTILNPRVRPFEDHADRYDNWFETHPVLYDLELRAVDLLLPHRGSGIEIGVGTGRFAAPLDVHWGIDPAPAALAIANARGVRAVEGVAEHLPFDTATFDRALMVTTICFLNNLHDSLQEAYRILKPGGVFVVGFLDVNRFRSKLRHGHGNHGFFYEQARFYCVDQVLFHMVDAGFTDFEFRQTLLREETALHKINPVTRGFGLGSFVVARGRK